MLTAYLGIGVFGVETITDPSVAVKQGQVFEILVPPPIADTPLPQDIPLDIVFEDEHLIVINKPAGLTVHPAPGNKDGTLVNGLLHHCPDLPGISGKLRPGIVHRLDKDTTGCIVIAKSQEALVRLQAQIQKRIASREYFAVVHGVPGGDSGTIVGAIGRHPVDRKKYAVVSGENGRYACTHWTLVERLGDYSLLRFKLDTGRTHQIRVHLAWRKHPLIGDPVYAGRAFRPAGASAKLLEMLDGFCRQALHARELSFAHPQTREAMCFQADLPTDMSALIACLAEEDPV